MDAQFDRGDVDRASLDATERLRARLSSRPAPAPQQRQRSVLPWVIAASLFVFVAGMVANPWFERNVRKNLPFTEATQSAATDDAAIKALADRLAQVEGKSATPGAAVPSERLARTEAKIETSTDQIAREGERIDKLTSEVAALSATIAADKASEAAAAATVAAAADRAQAMLTLVLVRRAVDAGRPLGPLEPVLRQSFEARYPQAVGSVAALGTAPVTLASLRRDFIALRTGSATRAAAETRQGWWDTLTSTVMDAVSRAPGDPQRAPLDLAAAALARGDVAAAATQLRRVPTPRPAEINTWLAAADRFMVGNAALASLEAATVLPPPPAPPAKTS